MVQGGAGLTVMRLCCGVAPEGQRGQGLHGERGQETDRHGSAHQVSCIGIIRGEARNHRVITEARVSSPRRHFLL